MVDPRTITQGADHEALLASAGEFQGVRWYDQDEREDTLVTTLTKRSVTAGANRRVRRGILGAAKMAKDMTTAAIRKVLVVKEKIRQLQGEEEDQPFQPIDVDAILKAEGYKETPSREDDEDSVPLYSPAELPLHQVQFPPPSEAYPLEHAEGFQSEGFHKV
ncbi:hypothetical protein HPB50_019356 [Hyalomma asiaticum]|uniref:Uncharacterized protein n=1 Tax=Hyalomma asiaticum TaxID=266040 RepID=A0ACB7SGX0_HYAAI|nr:hypothetical protein HPB50_019356 [Hyalomma asiaticum]